MSWHVMQQCIWIACGAVCTVLGSGCESDTASRQIAPFNSRTEVPYLSGARHPYVAAGTGNDFADQSGAVPPIAPAFSIDASNWVRLAPGQLIRQATGEIVVIDRTFEMMTTEVTEHQWEALMGNNPTHPPMSWDLCPRQPGCPVNRVSWWDALAFANAVSDATGLPACYDLSGCTGEPGTTSFTCGHVPDPNLDCRGARLPTDSEWEYAARAGTTTTYPCGEDPDCISDLEIIATTYKLSPVASRPANPWGLHDMLGNVREWVWDAVGPDGFGPSRDPSVTAARYRVYRGGAFNVPAADASPAARRWSEPDIWLAGLGFRLARTVSE